MTPDVLPAACAVALKEWATVLTAMERGEQLVLIRKGGLIEPGGGFELIANTFVCYPTFEHQAINYLREPFRSYFEEAARQRPADGRVRLTLCGVATASVATQDPQVLERLRPFHIYNEAFLSQRLKWQPEQPLTIVIVRAYRLATPRLLAPNPRYAGCTSWVDLDEAVALGASAPVLDDVAYQARAAQVTAAFR